MKHQCPTCGSLVNSFPENKLPKVYIKHKNNKRGINGYLLERGEFETTVKTVDGLIVKISNDFIKDGWL